MKYMKHCYKKILLFLVIGLDYFLTYYYSLNYNVHGIGYFINYFTILCLENIHIQNFYRQWTYHTETSAIFYKTSETIYRSK